MQYVKKRHPKTGGGRPTVMTLIVIGKLEEAFAMGCTDIEACLYAGINRDTLYGYQNKYPEFVDRKEELKETPVLKARKTVVEALTSDHEFSLKYLERKKKDEFSLRVENTGKDGKDIVSQIIVGDIRDLEPKKDE
jgi:hypothetical protein